MDLKFKKIVREAQINSKRQECFICHKKCTSFCQSHTIPKFILKNISLNGMNYSIHKFTYLGELGVEESEKGDKKASNFYLICNDCDNHVFKLYENECNLVKPFDNLIMAQIALKNYLRQISKNYIETEIYNILLKRHPGHPFVKKQISIEKMDYNEFTCNAKACINIIEKQLKSGFRLIYYKVLDYVVPLACQDKICLYTDLNGNILNDIYDYDVKLKMKYIHVAVFPLKDKTVVSLFRHTCDSIYKRFENQFNKLSEEEKLRLISFIIINYSEEFYLSKKIDDKLLKNSLLKRTAGRTNFLKYTLLDDESKIMKSKQNEIKEFSEFINLLSKDNNINL